MKRWIVILVLTLSLTCYAKEKQRAWQTGILLDTDTESHYAGSIGRGEDNVHVAIYRASQTYVIEIGDVIYECRERKRAKAKGAPVTVNTSIQVAIEKDNLYLIDEHGKEHKTDFIKKTAKSKPPS